MITHINSDNFQKEIVDSEIPALIDFWAGWCMPCKMLGPVFEEVSKEYEGKVKFAKVNTDEEQQIAMNFGIQGIPALVFSHKGKEIDRIVGFMEKEQLKAKIDEILEKFNASK